MNILITGDDGPDSPGLHCLQEAAKQAWPQAKRITVVPERDLSGQGMAITTKKELEDMNINRVDTDFYTVHGRPADVVHVAFILSTNFLPERAGWNLVLCGVNKGRNTGFDIFHSGTTGAAMIASAQFGCPAFSFAQDCSWDALQTDGADRKLWDTADRHLLSILRETEIAPGECWNINFPRGTAQGYAQVPAAHYSGFRNMTTQVVPQAALSKSDETELRKGLITMTELQLRVNVPISY